MAQTRSENPRHTDAHGVGADGARPGLDLPAPDEQPLDLTEQIESLIQEIEQTAAEVDPYGDAAARGAERALEDQVREIEPSAKAKAIAVEAAMQAASAQPVDTSPAQSAVTPDLPTEAAPPGDAAGAHALEAVLDQEFQASAVAPAFGGASEPGDAEQSAVPEATAPPDESVEPPAAVTDNAATGPSLATELDDALTEATAALEQIAPPEDPIPESPVVPCAATDTPQAEAPAAEPAPGGASEPAPGPAAEISDIDMLDADLARQADELEKKFREAEESQTPASFAEAEAAAGNDAEAPDAGTEHQAGVARAEVAPASSEPIAVVEDASAVAPASVGAPAPAPMPSAAPAKGKKPATAKQEHEHAAGPASAGKRAFGGLGGKAFAAVARVGAVLGWPLSLLPNSAREVVTYLGAVTLFNALAVWGYMLFVHKPELPPFPPDAPALHATEPPPKTPGEGHEGGEGHGDPHAKSDGSHTGKSEGSNKSKSEGSHGSKSEGSHESKSEGSHASPATHAKKEPEGHAGAEHGGGDHASEQQPQANGHGAAPHTP